MAHPEPPVPQQIRSFLDPSTGPGVVSVDRDPTEPDGSGQQWRSELDVRVVSVDTQDVWRPTTQIGQSDDAGITAIVAAVPEDPHPVVSESSLQLLEELRIRLSARSVRAGFTAGAGEVLAIDTDDPIVGRVILAGVGDGTDDEMACAARTVAPLLRPGRIHVTDILASTSATGQSAFIADLARSRYRFSRTSSEVPDPVAVWCTASPVAPTRAVVEQALVRAEAVNLARDLANLPGNEKSPERLAEVAELIGAAGALNVRVWDESDLRADGFGGILAVGSGSARESRFVTLSYRGAPQSRRQVAIVGKGITFDSGGLSLKPADGMPLMKTDMSGAATVLAVMSSLQDLGLPVNVTGVIACAQNMPGARAYRPGDVITHYGGITSEVFNTDAEGRMVLADALAYIGEHIRPTVTIDVATLTGAASLALSRHMGVVYSPDEGLRRQLVRSGERSGDLLWPMPLIDDYRDRLDSDVADLAHVGRHGAGAGSITAALFLQRFAPGRAWAHLDIAGPARAEKPRPGQPFGATGFGVRLLLDWLESFAAR